MADENLRTEIELLRKQLNDMQKEREAADASAVADADKHEMEEETGKEESTSVLDEIPAAENEEAHDLAAQFRELLDSIDKDLNEAKPKTLLIVFALGVLLGRLGR